MEIVFYFTDGQDHELGRMTYLSAPIPAVGSIVDLSNCTPEFNTRAIQRFEVSRVLYRFVGPPETKIRIVVIECVPERSPR